MEIYGAAWRSTVHTPTHTHTHTHMHRFTHTVLAYRAQNTSLSLPRGALCEAGRDSEVATEPNSGDPVSSCTRWRDRFCTVLPLDRRARLGRSPHDYYGRTAWGTLCHVSNRADETALAGADQFVAGGPVARRPHAAVGILGPHAVATVLARSAVAHSRRQRAR